MIGGSALDWGSLPQWLGLLAGIVATAAFISSRRDIARTQASQVYVLVQEHHFRMQRVEHEEGGHSAVGTLDLDAVLHNEGPTPITDCYVVLYEPGGQRRWLWWTSRSQRDWWSSPRILSRSYYTIAARSSGEPVIYNGPIAHGDKVSWTLPTLLALFIDSAGRRWIKWPDGRLSRHRRQVMFRGRTKRRRTSKPKPNP